MRKLKKSATTDLVAILMVAMAGSLLLQVASKADGKSKSADKQAAKQLSTQKLPPANASSLTNVPQADLIAREFLKGAIYGKVLDINGKPVPGATVAIQGKDGKIMVWTLTNDAGEYSLPADPKDVLHLRPSKRKGLLEQCARAVGDVVTAPIKAAGTAVANPGKTLAAAAVSAATGTPVALAAQMAIPGATNRSLVQETEKKAKEMGARAAVGDLPQTKAKTEAKGEAHILVSAPSFKAVTGAAGAYWMESASPEAERPVGMQAWLETIHLAPAASDKKSEVAQEAVRLTDAILEPIPVTTGGTVGIAVRLQAPPGLERRLRIFAREARTSTVVELFAREEEGKKEDGKALFIGTMALDPRIPAGETIISIAALRIEPVEVKLDKQKADPLFAFVRRLDDMQASKTYEYDPRIMASENRLDVKLLVLDASRATPINNITPKP